jgi:hypothetical protein
MARCPTIATELLARFTKVAAELGGEGTTKREDFGAGDGGAVGG